MVCNHPAPGCKCWLTQEKKLSLLIIGPAVDKEHFGELKEKSFCKALQAIARIYHMKRDF